MSTLLRAKWKSRLPPDAHTRPGSGVLVEAYCVKCKEKREVKDPQQVTMKNGRPATKGVCPVCGTGLYKIGG